MAVTQRQRLAMHARLVDIMGQDDAEILMEHLPTVAWDQIATKDDLKASELRVLAELAKTNAALVETNAAIVKTNSELADTRVSFKEALLATNAEFVTLRGDVQLGFARLERRLAWYLVAVVALFVGFGLAVWIPLVGALADLGSPARSDPAPEPAAAVVATENFP